MKRLAVLLLTLVMAAGCALAEGLPFDAVQLEFEDYGFSICLPEDWVSIELTEADVADGLILVAASPDHARTVSVAFIDLEMYIRDTEELAELLGDGHTGVSIEEINGIEFVVATAQEDDVNLLYTLDSENDGVFMFCFMPASDEAFLSIAQGIAGSIDTL